MRSEEINHTGYHVDHPNTVNPSSQIVQDEEYENERSFIIFEMAVNEENKVEVGGSGWAMTEEINLFKTVKKGLKNTRDTVSALNRNTRNKIYEQEVDVALPELVRSAEKNLEEASARLPGENDIRVEVPFTDPEEADRYLDIAERELREALEYLDQKAKEEGLHQLEGQEHHRHAKHPCLNSRDYLDPEDYALFEIVDDALGIDLAPVDSDRAYVCDVEELGDDVNEVFYDNQGRLERARSSLPDSGYEASHLETGDTAGEF